MGQSIEAKLNIFDAIIESSIMLLFIIQIMHWLTEDGKDIAQFPKGKANMSQLAPTPYTISSPPHVLKKIRENPGKEWFQKLSKGSEKALKKSYS